VRFSDLSEQEILALAISSEEEDSKIYRGFARVYVHSILLRQGLRRDAFQAILKELGKTCKSASHRPLHLAPESRVLPSYDDRLHMPPTRFAGVDQMCAGWAHSGDGNDGRLGGAFPDTIVMRDLAMRRTKEPDGTGTSLQARSPRRWPHTKCG